MFYVEVLQHLIVGIDVHFNIYYPVSLLLEAVYNRKNFLIMDWPVVLHPIESFCVILNWMKLLAFIDNMV